MSSTRPWKVVEVRLYGAPYPVGYCNTKEEAHTLARQMSMWRTEFSTNLVLRYEVRANVEAQAQEAQSHA